MKWFKHLAGSLKDSLIFEAIEKFGSDAYLVFFGTLEMMADEFDIYNPETVTISIKKMTNLFQLSRQKTIKILSFFDEKAKTFQRENKSFFAEVNQTHVVIICKRFAELADNHTLHELKKTSKLLRSDYKVTSPQDIKKEDNTDKEDIKKEETTLKDIYSKEYTSPEVSGDEKLNGHCPHQEIIQIYHSTLPSLSKVKEWTEQRQKILRSRWKEKQERQCLEWWSKFFSYVAESDFLMGRMKPEFQADLEWLVRPKNFVKVIEGKYHRAGNNLISQSTANILGWADRERERLQREGQQ